MVEPTARPGWENMAIDRALLDQATREGACYLRLYRWSPYCLSFGRHEPAARRYDRERIERAGIPVVRRPTGGRAVWHAREVTYAVAAPTANFGTLAEAYHSIHEALARALRALGVPASLAPHRSRVPCLEAGPCFAAPVGGEVLVAGRKVVGSAQLRRGPAFLQHGSILLEDSQATLLSWLRMPRRSLAPEAVPSVPLADRSIGFPELADAIVGTFTRWQGPVASVETDGLRALHEAADRHAARFRDDGWTWRR